MNGRVFAGLLWCGVIGCVAPHPLPAAEALLPADYGHFDLAAVRAELPKESDRAMVERRLVDNGGTGVRVFRVYRPIAAHYHHYSDTVLKVLAGEADLVIDGGEPLHVQPGDVVFWRAEVVHAVTGVRKGPVDFLAIDTPVRRPDDVQWAASP